MTREHHNNLLGYQHYLLKRESKVIRCSLNCTVQQMLETENARFLDFIKIKKNISDKVCLLFCLVLYSSQICDTQSTNMFIVHNVHCL